ncbi:MAG TPA: hypothetical protein GXX40_08630 [Firmicutes bacterium]|nr:hypothetical protein [Bacillota bacterium]
MSTETPASIEKLVNLSHLEHITDDTGIIQFCQGTQPDVSSGYTVDDNARALVVAALAYERPTEAEKAARLLHIYLRFLERARTPSEIFHNWFGPGWTWQDGPYTEDAVGHAVWALGVVTACRVPQWVSIRAKQLLRACLPRLKSLRFVRAKALCAAGIAIYLGGNSCSLPPLQGTGSRRCLPYETHASLPGLSPGLPVCHPEQTPSHLADGSVRNRTVDHRNADLYELLTLLADDLVRTFEENSSDCRENPFHRDCSTLWKWFEDRLTYANGIMPYSLFCCYAVSGDPRYYRTAVASVNFLNSVCVDDGRVTLVGNNGWYIRGRSRARFDQQPVDAMWLALANLAAWEVVRSERTIRLERSIRPGPSTHTGCLAGSERYARIARLCREWFLGKNDTGLALYDPATGACHDGLKETSINQNCGAESTIAGLMTLMATETV